MNTVILSAAGGLACPDGAPGDDPLPLLGRKVRLEDGFTLRSFFTMLARHPVLGRLGEFLQAAGLEAAKCPADGCRTDEFDSLELSRTVELVGFPGEPRLDIYTSLRGVGPGAGTDAGRKGVDIRFKAFELLLDMPVRLGRLSHVVLGDAVSVLEFDTAYSLFEFIEGIAWELGFHGAPKQCSFRG